MIAIGFYFFIRTLNNRPFRFEELLKAGSRLVNRLWQGSHKKGDDRK
jgi:hypothetical protein